MTIMDHEATPPKPVRRRLRFGIRGMLAFILVFGMAIGWIAAKHRRGRDDADFLADLARQGVRVNSREPSLLGLVAMKVPMTKGRAVEFWFDKWIGSWWFNRPVGFNAGRISEEDASRVAGRLRRFGPIHEVCFHSASLDGLRLFYVDKVPFERLGPDGGTCTFRSFDGWGPGPAPVSIKVQPKP